MARPVQMHVSENAFEDKLLAAAAAHGWRCHAERKATVSVDRFGKKRVITPIKGHAGYVDVTMAHASRGIVFAELKTDKGRLGEGQPEWITTLAHYDVPGSPVLVEVWRPADWDAIIVCLAEGVGTYRARFRGARKA
jgi:hypothetical protein